MKKIEIICKPDGTTEVSATGYQGKSCTDATKAIREALGEEVAEVKKPEFYQAAPLQQQQRG